MKTLWLTSLIHSEEKVKNLVSLLKTYGLEIKGHFWEDNLEKMAWVGPREELIKPESSLWLILANAEQLKSPSLRYGLTLLAMTVQAKRGPSFPIGILLDGKDPFPSEDLPTPLKGADLLSTDDPGMAAKLVAKFHTAPKPVAAEYRLNVYGTSQIGQWFEVGPTGANWPGAMFGVSGGEIDFHAVGPKGSLPGQSVLNYPARGLRLTLGEREYTAWAAQNEIDMKVSYFVRVKGFPDSLVFGPFTTGGDAELFVVKIK